MFGWTAFTWITFLIRDLRPGESESTMIIGIPYLTITCIALLAAATRQSFFLLAASSAYLFLAAFFMFATEYWSFWTQSNVVISFLCLLLSAYLFAKGENSFAQVDS
ncbi:MAG: hypothetical protein ACI95C_002651 [Pseudohongiellaceae bacterium]|jgi:hypothetical protein